MQSHLHAETILQLQITMEFCRPHMHEKHLEPHLQCGTDPTMIRPHTRPSRTRRTAQVDHRRSGTNFVWKNTGFGASAISQKRISCEISFKIPSATPPPAPRANPIYSEGTILELQITMGIPSATHPPAPLAIPFTLRERSYSANHNGILSTAYARKTLETPFTMRNRSENDPRISDHDPTTHETVSHPSHRRGRSSAFGDGLCMENTGFGASVISQKRISCETSFKIPSATPPPAPLATPFMMRERS